MGNSTTKSSSSASASLHKSNKYLDWGRHDAYVWLSVLWLFLLIHTIGWLLALLRMPPFNGHHLMFVDQGGKRASGRVRFELLPQLCDRCDKLTLVSNNHFLIEQPGAQERGHQKIGNCVLIMSVQNKILALCLMKGCHTAPQQC